jgi:hypothetical protein
MILGQCTQLLKDRMKQDTDWIWPAPHAILWIYIDWLRKWC